MLEKAQRKIKWLNVQGTDNHDVSIYYYFVAK